MATESGPGRDPGTPPAEPDAQASNRTTRRAAKGRRARDRETARRVRTVAIWVGVAVVVATAFTLIALGEEPDDDGTQVPPPTASELADTVQLLGDAYRAQGICYGWRLDGGRTSRLSVGSNLGDGVEVEDDPRCERWVKIAAVVTYTSESSESSDLASYEVTSSDDLAGIDYETGLKRLDLPTDAFVDDPGWAVCRAAVFLPLLVAESGAAPAAPTKTVPPGSAQPVPAALPDSGGDFWRDRWAYLVGAGGLFLITALLLTVGWFERRHQLPPPGAAARARRPPASRR
ncbi:hypothetical protein ACI2K4_20350 [Micromonospora sp. NPDC050397]|uniref:hypothetical protein n=1 Tax=Micromonospora sp. NPDC050397 TaxID=3364279 RepID=UPI00384BEA5F